MSTKSYDEQPFSLRVEAVTGEANAALMSVLSTASTWLSPVPEAAMTTGAIVQIFGLPPFVAVCVAASLELVGINVNSRFLEAQAFNDDLEAYRAKYKATNYRHPPEDAEGAKKRVVWFYLITGAIVSLTAFYQVFADGDPPIKLLACLFPVASFIGTRVANERAAFRRKVVAISENENQPKATVKHDESLPKEPKAQPPVEMDYSQIDTKAALLAFYAQNPRENNTKAAEKVGVTPQRVGQILREMEAAGQIKRNGQGVEVLT